mgnify:FL=1
MKPKIGFNTDVFVEDSGRTVTRMNILYSDLIIQHGGIPVIFPPGVLPQEVASGLDGFFLIGGDDYKCSLPASGEIPDRYLEVHPRREETDLNWASWLIKSDLPVLGLCGGWQALCGAAGGTIYGDSESEVKDPVQHRRIGKGDLPSHIVQWHGFQGGGLPPGSFEVNSSHHQSVATLPTDWRILASTSDGIIEACCDPAERIIGIQWHPELNREEPLGHFILNRFIEQVRSRLELDSA